MIPVTIEELEQITNGCANLATDSCEECKFIKPDGVCGFHAHIKAIASRPDPLALLNAWRTHSRLLLMHHDDAYKLESKFIAQLRTDPAAVETQAREQGWYP